MSKSLGNVVLPTEICDKWARTCFACGRLAGISGGREDERAGDDTAQRGLSEDPHTIRFALGISTASILRAMWSLTSNG